MTLISETVASANSSISLSSIPGTYKQLLLVWHGIVHSALGSNFSVRLNNDSGNNYKHGVAWNYNTSASGRMESATELALLRNGDSQGIFGKSANVNGLEYDAKGQLLIDNYASTTKKKFFDFNASFYNHTDNVNHFGIANGTYDSTSAITSIDIVRLSGTATISNSTNTSIRLYGIS